MSALDDQRDPSPPEVTPLSNQQEPAQLSTPPGELNEPATPQATTALDLESGNADSKERRTPAKKNRTSAGALEATQEETEDEAGTSGSPPHETKIRQISQGVEDITWRQMRKDAPTEGEHKMDEDTSSAAQREQGTGDSTPTKVPESTSAGDSENGSQEPIELPPLLRGENPPIVDEMAGDIEDTGAAAGAEQPADSHVPGALEPATAQVPDPKSASTAAAPEVKPSRIPRLPPHRRDSDSDQEKGLKRKLGDRTVSERLLPGETVRGLSGAPAVAATKRPRDDPEEDPNSREKKRPTPPPEEDEKKDEPKAAAPAETRSAFDQEDEQSEEEKKLNLQQQEVHTGEEDEDTVYQVRGKLFALSPQNQWKERGTGTLRLNVRREDGGGARLVMRKEAVYTVLLNATLFKGMRCFLAQDPRYIRFSVIEGAVTTHYNLRVQSAKVAEELLEEINAHIPTD
ncbi:hypothetical protein BN946_scf184851.g66 [Trametes cinnabarina]|uniref:RanBD1 domain-containing protein n=1 Tax=Pycnoporus cinnabarinus TaxID=5643 RepID=A0A060SBB7_PYCCI|nr:hypothetical protein BN946_scf184851.g66 [Trametes cinnabarina]